MGSLTHVKDEVHSARIGIGLDTTLQDARYAFRGLRRSLHFEAGAG